MIELIKSWCSIAFLTGKPWQLPGDQNSLRVAIAAALTTYVAVVSMQVGLFDALSHALFDIGVAALALYVGLSLVSNMERFVQAFHAYCGASTVLNLASLPMLDVFNRESEPQSGLGSDPESLTFSIPVFAEFVYLVWGISVVAHIIRFTFDTTIAISVLISTGYLFLYVFLMSSLLVN